MTNPLGCGENVFGGNLSCALWVNKSQMHANSLTVHTSRILVCGVTQPASNSGEFLLIETLIQRCVEVIEGSPRLSGSLDTMISECDTGNALI